jgi:CheY-like chemotaxis protein
MIVSTDTSGHTVVAMAGRAARLIAMAKPACAGHPKHRFACAGAKTVDRKGYILVIETDDLIRELLERWLVEAGHTVVACAASDPAPEGAVRLVIADVESPRRADARIASLQAAYQAPMLVLSARFRRGLGTCAAAARQLGVQGVLPKPFTRADLLAAVSETIEDP